MHIYVPIDIQQPKKRINEIIEQAGIKYVRKLQVQVGHPAVENWFHLSPSFG